MKPWERTLGINAGRALIEFARFTRLRPIEIFAITEVINKIKAENKGEPKNNLMASYTNIRDWMGGKYLNIKPRVNEYGDNGIQDMVNHHEQKEIASFESFSLIVTDYEVNTETEKGLLLAGYESRTATLFTSIRKMKPKGSLTFSENDFYGFIQDIKERLAEITRKPGQGADTSKIRLYVNLVKSDGNSPGIEFSEIEEGYNNTDEAIFETEKKGYKYLANIRKETLIIKMDDYKCGINNLCLKEINSIKELRSLAGKMATKINKTIKTVGTKPHQDTAIREFIETFQWVILDRKG
ncbi:MAG: hypothetical protein ACXV8Q_04055 [Methylobacter sp.]